MSENTEFRQPEEFKFDERLEWYQVNGFLLNLARVSAELGFEPTDMVHLGGTANFYRFYQAFGPRAVIHYRGTHDMDVISFRQGAVEKVLSRLVSDYKKEKATIDAGLPKYKRPDNVKTGSPRLHSVRDYSSRRSLSLPDKKSIYVNFDYNDIPGMSSGFEIDVYESQTGKIRFNDRVLTREKLVLDPPEELILPTNHQGKTRGLVAVPSLRDYFLIKTDIIDFSNSGLRPKDKFDVLTSLRIAHELGVPFERLINGVVEASDSWSAAAKLSALEDLFRAPKAEMRHLAQDYPFFPNQNQLKGALTTVQKAKSILK